MRARSSAWFAEVPLPLNLIAFPGSAAEGGMGGGRLRADRPRAVPAARADGAVQGHGGRGDRLILLTARIGMSAAAGLGHGSRRRRSSAMRQAQLFGAASRRRGSADPGQRVGRRAAPGRSRKAGAKAVATGSASVAMAQWFRRRRTGADATSPWRMPGGSSRRSRCRSRSISKAPMRNDPARSGAQYRAAGRDAVRSAATSRTRS